MSCIMMYDDYKYCLYFFSFEIAEIVHMDKLNVSTSSCLKNQKSHGFPPPMGAIAYAYVPCKTQILYQCLSFYSCGLLLFQGVHII